MNNSEDKVNLIKYDRDTKIMETTYFDVPLPIMRIMRKQISLPGYLNLTMKACSRFLSTSVLPFQRLRGNGWWRGSWHSRSVEPAVTGAEVAEVGWRLICGRRVRGGE